MLFRWVLSTDKGAVAGTSSSSSFTFGHTAGRRKRRRRRRRRRRGRVGEEGRSARRGSRGEEGRNVCAWPRRRFLPWLDVGSWPALAIHRKPSSGAPPFACTLFHLPLPLIWPAPPGPNLPLAPLLAGHHHRSDRSFLFPSTRLRTSRSTGSTGSLRCYLQRSAQRESLLSTTGNCNDALRRRWIEQVRSSRDPQVDFDFSQLIHWKFIVS